MVSSLPSRARAAAVVRSGNLIVRPDPVQEGRFRELAPRFGSLVSMLSEHAREDLTTDYWSAWANELRDRLSPTLPRDFFRDSLVAHTMFVGSGGRWMKEQLAFLEARCARGSLRRLLHEDGTGRPRIQSLRYRTSHNRIHHAYHLARFVAATRPLEDVQLAVEWGGGYGSLARVFGRMHGGTHTYAIVDLPVMTALQYVYLGSTLGPDCVHLVSEPHDSLRPGLVNLVPVGLCGLVSDADLFISTWALSESTPAAEDLVIGQAWFGASRLLLAYSEGTLGRRAAREGATTIPIGAFLPRNDYAFR